MKTNYCARTRRLSAFLSKSMLFIGCLMLCSFGLNSQTKISKTQTDKARYNPGSTVYFNAYTSQSQSGVSLRVKYYRWNTLLSTQTVSISGTSANWSWVSPSVDHRGYLVSIELMNGSTRLDWATIGVNVSSDYKKFPIYGFLSSFPYKTDYEMDVVMEKLNRYHINVIQYYDWMDTHHKPLAGTPLNPSATWNDLANRLTYFETIKGYIDRGHNNFNMRSHFYSLIYGAYSYSYFPNSWYLYNDQGHTQNWNVPMPTGWEATAIDMMDLNSADWRNYFLANLNDVYNATNLHFDGWHVDQLGDWGYKYNSLGQQVDVAASFPIMLQAAKNAQPNKSLVMNAVDGYGQSLIHSQPVDMLYTECWGNFDTYSEIRDLIQNNESMNPGLKNVLAAYVNRSRSGSTGTFSDGAVLLCDATIFALGGAHIELGEHMLCNEYYPNNNLAMSSALQTAIVNYYDFLVAYQNILRDGRQFNGVTLSGTGAQYWPPVKGKIATVGASWGGNQVFHCINYTNVNTLNWQDDQPVPTTKTNISMSFPYSTTITRMWVASPDVNKGVPQTISFTQSNGVVSFKLPSIKYWTMVVAETSNGLKTAEIDEMVTALPDAGNASDYLKIIGNASETRVIFSIQENQWVKMELYDIQGHKVSVLTNANYSTGEHVISMSNIGLKPGVYVCRMLTNSGAKSNKLVIQ